MNKTLIPFLLKTPLLLLVLASLIASIYLAIKKSFGITFVTPVILGIIVLLYIIAMIIERKKDF